MLYLNTLCRPWMSVLLALCWHCGDVAWLCFLRGLTLFRAWTRKEMPIMRGSLRTLVDWFQTAVLVHATARSHSLDFRNLQSCLLTNLLSRSWHGERMNIKDKKKKQESSAGQACTFLSKFLVQKRVTMIALDKNMLAFGGDGLVTLVILRWILVRLLVNMRCLDS